MTHKQHNPIIDIIAAVGLMILAFVFYSETINLADSPYEPLGPAAVPKALLLLILVCALVMLIRGAYGLYQIKGGGSIRKAGLKTGIADPTAAPADKDRGYRTRPVLAVMVISLLVLYIGLLHWKFISYRSGCILFMLSSGLVILWHEKRAFKPFHVAVLAVLTLLMAFGGHYVFTEIFIIDLP